MKVFVPHDWHFIEFRLWDIWCEENAPDAILSAEYPGQGWIFSKEEDALAFKIRFGI